MLQGCTSMYLGTMMQFRAAQRLYEKHGYGAIARQHLPRGYVHHMLATVFYHKLLVRA